MLSISRLSTTTKNYINQLLQTKRLTKYFMRHNHDDIEDATDNDDEPTFDENAAKRLK